MLRLCGAEKQRLQWSQEHCWCGGLFCGKGGFIKTRQFRHQFHGKLTASSRAQFMDLMVQADLYDGDKIREVWILRLDAATRNQRQKAGIA